MNRFFIVAAYASVALLSGCSNDELANVEKSTQNMISFHVVGNRAETRATPITQNNLTSTDFDVFAFTADGTAFMGKNDTGFGHDGINIKYANGQWSYSNPDELRYWPEETPPLSFYAFNPGTVSETMQYYYMWDVDHEAQKIIYSSIDEYGNSDQGENYDVMYAMAKGQTKSTNNGMVKLQFKHILSQVVFKAKNQYANMQVDIKGIKIHNVELSGTFTLPETAEASPSLENWKLNGLAGTATVVKDASVTVKSSTEAIDITSTTPMLIVPQNLTGWNVNGGVGTKAEADDAKQCYLEISCKIRQSDVYLCGSATEFKTIYVPFGAEWQPGKRYIYTLVFGGGYDDQGVPILKPIHFIPEVDEWRNTSEEHEN